ncbi:hypothetical protein I601_0948 [Nocardioides dokdonensis FR1436]|uniref:PH domain-containing protein n=1 Tax=Nocardioides dokdonensis FR1436 TaxID=1300347 RepID=A0A1A9GIQ4_9ACTN|nr:hypothetical protein [Nocardioides dokdonensis]ANH37391.1 hypothetical protein I601_0948 [Nocardioides dokdonensis FR1436]
MAEGEQVGIPRLVSQRPTVWLSMAVTVLGVIAVVGWGVATQTGTNRVMAVLLAVVLPLAVTAVVWRRTWVDTGDGTLHHRIALLPTRSVSWARAAALDLERNRAGQLALRASGEGGTVRVTVLAIDMGGDRSADADLLRFLAGEIDRWAPERERLTARLRAQAAYVETGADLRRSPLAAHV